MTGKRIPLIWPHDPTLHAPAKYRRACSYEAYVPDNLIGQDLSLDSKVAGSVSEAENAIRDLNTDAKPTLAPLARLLLRTESIASSKIEGMQIGVRDLARAEARAETGARVGTTAREVLANIDAMQAAVEDAAKIEHFSVDQIRATHERLMLASPTPRVAGKIRTQQNWIGGNDYNPCGADYVPPPPEYVSDLLSDLCDAINNDELSPLVQAALIHAQFESIHPFADGNGRTGRALIQVVLRRRGLAPAYVPPISVVLAKSRDGYIAGLTNFRNGQSNEWIEQFAEAAARAAYLAKAYLRSVAKLTTHWREQLAATTAPRADAAAWAVIEALPAYPTITAPAATAATRRAKAAIYQAIGELVSAGILLPLSTAKRNQSWEAAGLLELLTSLEAGEEPEP
ncbi:MAG: Fic family protein [Gemmatimonadaceae bacterium]